MTLINIILALLFISVSAVCIFFIIYLKKITEHFEEVNEEFHLFVENTIPILNNLNKITQRVNKIITGVEGYWEELDQSIITVRGKISNSDLWAKFKDGQTRVLVVNKTFRAIVKGISTFWHEYRRR